MQRQRVVRVAWRVGVLLLVGAVVNVGVAWWCTALTMRDVMPRPAAEEREIVGEAWPLPVPDAWPTPQGYSCGHFNRGFALYAWDHNWHLAHPHEEDDPENPEAFMYILSRWRSGWPFESMEWHERREIWSGAQRKNSSQRASGRLTLPAWCRRAASAFRGEEVTTWNVPLLPSWSGFVANTVVYTVALLVPVEAWGLRRRKSRRRRGACVICGYDARGLTMCPECGR